MKAIAFLALAALCLVLGFSAAPIHSPALAAGEPGAPPAPALTAVEPKEIADLFANPGMGWQTFHRFADGDPNLDGLPSSSAYFRFYWSELEPQEGKIDFARLDEILAHARRAGQRLAFRVMCAGTSNEEMYVPRWLRDKGCPGFEYRYQNGRRTYWAPDMDHPLFQEAHFRLIRELGRRYDGHRDLDLVDIGSVGLWGEWHMSGTGVRMPSPETRRKIIAAWCEAFPKTPRVMLIGDEEGMRIAAKAGSGWRADCLGDMGGFSKTWNHMEHFYRQALEKSGTRESWIHGPVAFESCWDMRKWVQEGWDVRMIFDYALDLHASYVNNKSAPIPAGSRGEVERLLRRLGYRIVLRRLEHPPRAEAGKEIAVAMVWENVGTAPPYIDGRVAFRLRQASPEPKIVRTGTSIRGMLPGRREVTEKIPLDPGLAAGSYELDVGILEPPPPEEKGGGDAERKDADPGTGAEPWTLPRVRLAIAGRRDDGWYAVSRLEIVR